MNNLAKPSRLKNKDTTTIEPWSVSEKRAAILKEQLERLQANPQTPATKETYDALKIRFAV
jgi:hypothetical protein